MREMKDSLEQWLGKLPESWGLLRIASLYKIRNIKVSDKDYMPLSVTMNGIVPQLETAAKTNAHDDRKLVRKGDFAINSRSDRRGSCGISEYDGSVSLINTILAPLGEMNPNYYNWLFHTTQFADEFYKWGHGIVDDLWTTGWQDMKKIMIPVPPLQEQNEIDDFLNAKCTEIDALNVDIQTQIDTLEQYKRSIISETVTKGLNPNVQMKDSGMEWIKKIPKEWEVNRIKYLFKSTKGLSITKENLIEEGLPVISYGQIHSKMNTGVTVDDDLCRFVSNDYSKYKSSKIEKFDFAFADTSEDYEGCGNCVYKRTDDELYGGYHVIILKSVNKKDNRYFAYLFQTDVWRKQIRVKVSGVKVYSITQKIINEASVIIPPVQEQEAISNFLDTKCSEINEIIMKRKEQLEVLNEYKKSLIYEYVTGKKEVPKV